MILVPNLHIALCKKKLLVENRYSHTFCLRQLGFFCEAKLNYKIF
jgi:hypothetical protein